MAKLTVRWTELALEDLNSAREFISSEYPTFLNQTITEITQNIEQLIKFPETGRPGRVKGTRELIFLKAPFILVYRLDSRFIEIISLLHQSRKWP